MTDGPIPADIAATFNLTMNLREADSTGHAGYLEREDYIKLFEGISRALHRTGTSHVGLIAEPGVDPEGFLADFARYCSSGRIPFLKERQIILADTRHTIPEESRERLLALLASVAENKDVIVCISGFASLMRSPQGTNKSVFISALQRVACRLIGIMTPVDYEEIVAGDYDLEEILQRVELLEPSVVAAVDIVSRYAAFLSLQFRTPIDNRIVSLATRLASNYIVHERLPGKARRILVRACEKIHFDQSQLGMEQRGVSEDDVFREVSNSSGVPVPTLRGIAEKCDYRASLGEFIIGQEHAVGEVATELGLIKAGLTDGGKPASVMMFVGQTGTGKTEMAKALARFYSNTKRLRTYTLGNMVESHSVSSIIGVPPGYVGHDKGGKVVQDLNSDPHCVFLLDEADKAHPDVLQPFLNLFDEGWVRDQRGTQAFANKAIFILTTNVGQRMIADMARQGKSPEEMSTRMKETLSQIKHAKSNRPVFAPEFLARLKRVIVFLPLSRDAMLGICRKLVREMQESWRERRGKSFEIDDALIIAIADEAHRRNDKSDGKEGGRIVRKLLSDFIEASVQTTITEHPEAYTRCQGVRVSAILERQPSSETLNDVSDDIAPLTLERDKVKVDLV